MGLDISVYENLELVYTQAAVNLLDEKAQMDLYDQYAYLHVNAHFAKAAPGLVSGFYNGDYAGSFRAGSYGYYSHWRNQLALFAHQVSAETIWAHPALYQGEPFYELINFSDCEGTIGARVARKLATDFQEHDELAKEMLGEDYELYQDFKQAFVAASNQGAVCFL